LWTETAPKPDGSWLYCPLCRQNQLAKEVESVPVKSVPGVHKISLTPLPSVWLNSDTSEDITAIRPIIEPERERKIS
jgi:hypothetical protein